MPTTQDRQTFEMSKLHKAQNNLLRTLEQTKIKDQICIKNMLKNHVMLSINQLKAHIKIMEMWKGKNHLSYPINIEVQSMTASGIELEGLLLKNLKQIQVDHLLNMGQAIL